MAYPSIPPLPDTIRLDAENTWLTSFGFELIDTFEGVSLDSEISRRCAKTAERPPPRRPDGERVQLWAHPGGALVVSSSFWFKDTAPSLNSISLLGIQDLPLAQTDEGLRSFGLTRGLRVSVIDNSHTGAPGEPSASFKIGWNRLVSASSSSSLVPLEAWMSYVMDPGFSSSRSSFSSHMKKCLDLSLDWSGEEMLVSPSSIPAEQLRLVRLAYGSLRSKVQDATGRRAQSYPAYLSSFMLQALQDALKSRIEGHNLALSPSQKKVFLQGSLASSFVNLAASLPVPPVRLSEDQQQVCRDWINTLADARSIARTQWKNLPSVLPGLPGLAAHDLLLTHTHFPGAWEKLESQVRSASDAQLLRWVNGQEGLVPLAMGVAQTLLEIPNRGSRPDEQRRVLSRATAILDRLDDRLGDIALVWETTQKNIWAAALGSSLNLPTDEDLVELHEARLRKFLAWADGRHQVLPSVVRWASFTDPSVVALEFAPHELPVFAKQWEYHGPKIRQAAATLHWQLLGPLSALSARKELSDIAKGTGLVSVSRAPKL